MGKFDELERIEKVIVKTLYKYVCLDYNSIQLYLRYIFKSEFNKRLGPYLKKMKDVGIINMMEIDNKNVYVLTNEVITELSESIYLNTDYAKVWENVYDCDLKKYYYLSSFYINFINYENINDKASFFVYMDEKSCYPVCYISGNKSLSIMGKEGTVPYTVYAFTDNDNTEFLENIGIIIDLRSENPKYCAYSLMVNVCKNYDEVYEKTLLLSRTGKQVPVLYCLNANCVNGPLKVLFKCEYIDNKYVVKHVDFSK